MFAGIYRNIQYPTSESMGTYTRVEITILSVVCLYPFDIIFQCFLIIYVALGQFHQSFGLICSSTNNNLPYHFWFASINPEMKVCPVRFLEFFSLYFDANMRKSSSDN